MISRRAPALALVSIAIALGVIAIRLPHAGAHELELALLELREDPAAPGRVAAHLRAAVSRSAPDGGVAPIVPDGCRAGGSPRRVDLGTAIATSYELVCPAGLRGARIAPADRGGVDLLVRAIPADGSIVTRVLRPSDPAFAIPRAAAVAVAPGRAHAASVVVDYGRIGIAHILFGWDHLLFLVGLVVLARTARRVIATVTAFTVGHAVTLSLASLGVLHVPAAPVEATIALSILFVAVELARAPGGRPGPDAGVAWRAPWLVAAPFGLLHGLGFASSLAAVGLPRGEIPIALLAFNVGIELGQLAFVTIVVALLHLARRHADLLRGRVIPYAIGSLSSFWCIMRISALLAFVLLVLPACGDDGRASAADAGPPDATILPDEREPCADHDPLRRPLFGDLHVHTAYSFDAVTWGARNRPEDAIAFARGEPLGLPPYDDAGNPSRTIQLARPLDFVAVTDHAEFFAETELCNDPSSIAYDTQTCTDYRNMDIIDRDIAGLVVIVASPNPKRPDFCEEADCASRARATWQRVQDAAEEGYDRTAACSFTTLVGYEWSGTPLGNNLHRNVLFRNRQVPRDVPSYVEAPWPEELWRRLDHACTDAGTGCDVLTIPHNSNLSGGQMFVPLSESAAPYTAEEAARRAALEPLVEIFQHKGSSECTAGIGDPLGTTDELCAFENVHGPRCTGAPGDPPDCAPTCSESGGIGFLAECVDPFDFVRTALGAGLVEHARVGANPFQYGFIGSTDTHNATPGAVDERTFQGHTGLNDDTLAEQLEDEVRTANPGGLAVVWAEENSRDAIFDALRRRETYATSGTRPIVRFFGGRSYPDDLCERSDLIEVGYADGVPMGGVLPPVDVTAPPPRFVVSAMRDALGSPLQHLQIVKGSIVDGDARYDVFEIAGDPENGAGVDPATCEPQGVGADTLCSVWEDPTFDPAVPAFYYVRVIENPTCRWSAHACLAASVDCDTLPEGDPLAACCDGSVPLTVNERAWTSPIWYTP